MSEFFRPPRVTRSMAARFALLMVLATSAFAQQEPAKPQADNQCQTKCNVQASACMKPCSDEKDGEKMLACLKRCETANTQCKSTCTK